jgi:hypothetical protein
MPIPRDVFENGRRTKEFHLRRLFLENADKAYAVDELAERYAMTTNYVRVLLLVWMLQGFLISKELDGTRYYALKNVGP